MSAKRNANESLLVVGRVVAPRGVTGELKLDLQRGDPDLFVALRRVYLGEGREPFTVRRARIHLEQGLLSLEGIEDRDAAEQWRDAMVYAPAADLRELDADEYLVGDILGLRVVTDEGESLGEIIEIIATGANDVYVVRGALNDLLLPAIKQVILNVDIAGGTMTVHLLEGLR